MPEYEKVRNDKPKYEKPLVIDLSDPLMGEGDVQTCSSGPSGNNS